MKRHIFALFFIIQIGYSQTHIYEHFGVDEGLPSSEVYDVYQDKQGYVWFATDKGLSRYNGYEFKNYTTKDGLPGNTILDFYPQKNGQVWCYEYHSQSLFYFDEVFDGFKPYKFNNALKEQLSPNSIIKSVTIDAKGTLYTGGYYLYGYIEINKKGIIKRYFDLSSYKVKEERIKGVNLGIRNEINTFFSLHHDYKPQKDIFFINSKNITTSRLDFVFLNENNIVFIDEKLGVLHKNDGVKYYETEQYPIGIRKINNDSFFVGYYSNGAEIRDISGTIIERFLPSKSVSNFLLDAEGGYWFTTIDDGVFYIKNPDIKVLSEEHISSLVKDHLNNLYLGFENGNIGRHVNKTIETLYTGLSNDAALVEFDDVQNIIYGYADLYLKDFTHNKKSFYLTANKLPENIEDSIFASVAYGFYKRKNDSIKLFKSNYKVQDACSYNETILVATSSGLFIQKDTIIEPYQSLTILKSRIDDIDLNKRTNTLYMASQGAGVIVKSDSIYNITKKNGLTNNIVSEVNIENDSTVWACTNTGLNRITFKPNNTFDVATITKADGLLSNDIDDVEIINDTVWVATKKGLCYFKKDVLAKKETSKILSLSLKKVTVNNKRVYSENLKLKHSENNLDFKLQGISHKNINKINYLYRLKEIDTSWIRTTNREINFPSLSPGDYTFQAKASVLNNQNNHLISYTFKIRPPFWRSWWFYGICLLFVLGLVYLFFKIRVLTYNKDIIRELIRLTIKRLKRKEQLYKFRSNGEDFKIPSHDILYIKSHGNYLDITTSKKTYTIRCKIGDFIATTPDALEYLRVHRSYIIRIDQVSSKGRNWVVIKDQKIPVGQTYLNQLEKIQF